MNNILFLILNDKFPWSISHIQFLLIINSNFPRVPAHSLLAFGICHFLFSFRFRYLFLSAFFFWPRRNEFSNILSLKFFFSPLTSLRRSGSLSISVGIHLCAPLASLQIAVYGSPPLLPARYIFVAVFPHAYALPLLLLLLLLLLWYFFSQHIYAEWCQVNHSVNWLWSSSIGETVRIRENTLNST